MGKLSLILILLSAQVSTAAVSKKLYTEMYVDIGGCRVYTIIDNNKIKQFLKDKKDQSDFMRKAMKHCGGKL